MNCTTALPAEIPLYEAFGESGAYWRPARTIGELPHEMAKDALAAAAIALGLPKLQYGVSVAQTLKLTPAEARQDGRPWVHLIGADIPLHLFWDSNAGRS